MKNLTIANQLTILRIVLIPAFVLLVVAVLGFSGLAAGAAGIAKILFFAFLILGALSLIFGRRVPV